MSSADYPESEFREDLEKLSRLYSNLWVPRPSLTVAEYAEQRRVLPSGTPFPGPWDNSRTPYLVEIMEAMSPQSGIERVVITKGAQLGFTAAAENVIAYYMDASPTEILFVSATEGLLRKWGTKRLEPLIDSCGFRERIGPPGQLKQRRRTGDLIFSKEYPGGTLDMASAQSAASLRADSKRLLIRDEIDGAPAELKSGEGNWLDVSYARTDAWGERRKILDFSTPTTFDESAIWPEYLLGDCRKFSVPCPHCGGFQFLVWDGGGGKNGPGMKWTMNGRRIAEVWYRCEHCGDAIKNHHKGQMLAAGEWKATAISESETMRSYHLSSLYSPVGMLSWEKVVAGFIRAERSPAGLRAFINLRLGEPYKETGQRLKLEKLLSLRLDYKSGTIPSDDILFLTAAVDVQRGSEKKKEKPARIEIEVCGHGAGYRTWSIQYLVFEGAVDDAFSGAWAAFEEFVKNGGFEFFRKDGVKFSPSLTLIDSGDVESTAAVYSFAAGWINTYACKGSKPLKRQDDEKPDEATDKNLKKYRVSTVSGGVPLVVIASNYYKHLIYKSLEVPYKHTGAQRPGFCAFPQNYPDKYFEMLRAEERRRDGSFYRPGGRDNEALDLRVYNLAALDFLIDTKIQELRDHYKTQGASKAQLQTIRSPQALDWFAAMVKKRAAG